MATLFKKDLTVLPGDVTGGPLIDFPLLVSITDSDLKKNARSDGFDIFFTKSDGTTVIPYERESYNGSTGKLIAWVLVDLSDTGNNTFSMFYGDLNATDQQNPTAVWSPRSITDVFHFNQSTFPWLNSTTGNDFDTGTTLSVALGGEIGTSALMDNNSIGTTIEFQMNPSVIPVTTTDFYVSFWIKYDTISTTVSNFSEIFISASPLLITSTFNIRDFSAFKGQLFFLPINENSIASIFPIGDCTDLLFHHVSLRYTSSSTLMDIFFDGSLVSSNVFSFIFSINFDPIQCGGGTSTDTNDLSTERIDELQIAHNSSFNNGYVTTSFDNQKTAGQGAGNFVKVGVQQQVAPIIISNNYLLLSQGAVDETSSIINTVCGDSSLKIGDVVRLLPVGTGEGFTQPDDLLPRVGVVDETGTASYGIVVGGDFEGVYSEGEISIDLSQGLIASFFGDGVRICTQGRCLVFVNGPSPINIGDKLTSSANGLVKAFFDSDQIIAVALQIIDPTTIDDMLYEDLEIMEYQDLINMIYELALKISNNIIAVDVQREGAI